MSTVPRERELPGVEYPPAPWLLQGQMLGSLWLVPRESCSVRVDEALELLTVRGQACIFGGFVDYQPGSVLVYRELFAGPLVRYRPSRQVGFTVTHIWVDSEPSLRGGHALWGMPKRMARFEFDRSAGAHEAAAAWEGEERPLAQARFEERLWGLPRGWRLPLHMPPSFQRLGEHVCSPRFSLRSSPRLLRGHWSIPTQSPLAELGLAGASPLISFWLRDFHINLPAALPLG